MNAFAAGRRPAESLVAVTTGLLERLTREELQGVIGHEMAHIKSRDTLYNICAAVLVGAIALLSDMFLRGIPFRGRDRSGGTGRGRGNVAFLALGLLLALLAPIAAKILQMSISRQREYHADAVSAQFTRNPLGLASALEKISRSGARVPGENRGTQHLFIRITSYNVCYTKLLRWPVSASSFIESVGSSSTIFASISRRRSMSRRVLGSTTTDTTGFRISIDSRRMGAAGSQRVSPVRAFLIPRIATMSPATASRILSFFPAWIRKSRATFSVSPVV